MATSKRIKLEEQPEEEIDSGLRQVREKLDTVRQAKRVFDSREKEINNQRVTVKDDIDKEFDQLYKLIDQQKVQLVGKLDVFTQQKIMSLTAQREQVEIIQRKLSSCLEYAEGGLKTDTAEEVLAKKDLVLKRIEQVNAEFTPHIIQPEANADLQLLIVGKEQLQTACQQFVEIASDNDYVCLDNSYIDKDTLEIVHRVGEQKHIEFHARTRTNKQFLMNFDMTAELVHTKSRKRLTCEVFEKQNGTHEIYYQPANRGMHELQVTLKRKPVRGSPCLVNVIPSPQSLNGGPVRTIGDLNEPGSTAINSRGQIVVTETGGHCISIFSPEGEKVKTLFGTQYSGHEQMNPWAVAVDRNDNIYVTECGNNRIQKFTSEGKLVASIGSGNKHLFNLPSGLCFHEQSNSLYVCDMRNHRIQVLSKTLLLTGSFGYKGRGNGQFDSPCNIAIDDANNLFVTDAYNHRVQVFTAEGQVIRYFTNKANDETLKFPFAIAIDSSNTVYVSERRPHCVSVFTSQGDYITSFSRQGTNAGQFNYISGLTVDGNDSIVVSDRHSGQLLIL